MHVEPEADAPDMLRFREALKHLVAAPVYELNLHSARGSPVIPLLDVLIPLISRGFVAFYATVRQI